MLKPKNRLKLKKDFTTVFQKGRLYNSPYFILKFISNDLPDSRFGFIISKKVSKKAVYRNKIRRQLREIIRLHVKQIKTGHDFVVFCKPAILNLNFNYSFLETELLKGLQKTKTLS